MIALIRRLSLALLFLLLILGTAGHLFLSAVNVPHVAQEANCPIHSGMAQPERVGPYYIHKPAMMIGERQDGARAFILGAKIPHPPPAN
ncbi:MAG: hypothetical protein AB1345_06040 [Chloroflexota bacterium]